LNAPRNFTRHVFLPRLGVGTADGKIGVNFNNEVLHLTKGTKATNAMKRKKLEKRLNSQEIRVQNGPHLPRLKIINSKRNTTQFNSRFIAKLSCEKNSENLQKNNKV
jgi:hypothetical protein